MDATTRPGGGLYRLKHRTAQRLDGVVGAAVTRGTDPDRLTQAGFAVAVMAAAAVLAGGLVDPRWWLVLGPLVTARLLCAVADGAVARRSGRTTTRGAVLGEVTDRLGDVLLAAVTAVVAPLPAALAVVGLLLADDLVPIGWAVTGQRSFPGIGGKPDRNVLVAAGLGAAVLTPPLAAATVWALCGLVWVGAAARLRHLLTAPAAEARS
ncbi:hypothetical protein BH23ACT9_BH23ACT9_10290 [soil metagenome]